MIYGLQAVRELLRSGRPVERLFVLRGRRDKRVEEVIRAAGEAGVHVRQEERGQLDRLAGTSSHQGVVAETGLQRYLELDELMKRAAASPRPALVIVLDEVEDPQNLGAVIRTAEAAGAHGVVIPERRAAGVTPAVVKASAGASAHLPVARVGSLVQALERMKESGFWLYGLSASAATPYTAVDWRGPVALVAGSEGRGLRPIIRQHCDQLVAIPMTGRVGSLNVSVSVAVAVYEVVRQRAGGGVTSDGFRTGC